MQLTAPRFSNSMLVSWCLLIVLIVLAVQSTPTEEALNTAEEGYVLNSDGFTYKKRASMGQYDLDFTYRRSNYNKKLGTGRSTLKWVLYHKLSTTPISTVKATHQKDHLNCDLLQLTRSELLKSIDCRPSDELSSLVDQKAKESIVNYVGRSTLRFKLSSTFPREEKLRLDVSAYPLRKAVVEQEFVAIKTSLGNKYKLDRNPETNTNKLGYYFETTIYNKPGRCSGELYLAANATGSAENLHSDEADELDPVLMHDFENYNLILVRNVECGGYDANNILFQLMGSEAPSLKMNFLLLIQPEFPFITCFHKITVGPFGIWNYDGVVEQTQDSGQKKRDAYDMNININSSSELLPALDFELDQKFEFKDGAGAEKMILRHRFYTALVSGLWDNQTFWKELSVYTTILNTDSQILADSLKRQTLETSTWGMSSQPFVKVEFKNNNDELEFSFKLKKDKYEETQEIRNEL